MNRTLAAAANWVLAPMEWFSVLAAGRDDLSCPPVFVVGPPRSGTTLVSQVLLATFGLGRMTNAMGRFYRAPFFVGLLTKPFLDLGANNVFISRYGRTPGLAGPSEAGAFWDRWFGRHDLADPKSSASIAGSMRRAVGALTRLYGVPMLFKNTYNSFRIPRLSDVFPEGLFVHVHRDVTANAASLLRGRIEVLGDEKAWLGVEPPDATALRDRPYCEQVVEQVLLCHESIRRSRWAAGPHRFISIAYEELCAAPRREMARFRTFMEGHGHRLTAAGAPPRSFPQSPGNEIEPADLKRIKEYVGIRCQRRCQGDAG